MMRTPLLLLGVSLLFSVGCSNMSTLESHEIISPEAREAYVQEHPDCPFTAHIRCGEVKRGMNGNEVIASWGLPNVYMFSRSHPKEYWVYYVQDDDTKAMMIYTLIFEEGMLEEWDIDMKRYMDQRIVYDGTKRLSIQGDADTRPVKK